MGGGGLRLKDRQTENIIRINEKYKNKNFKYKTGFPNFRNILVTDPITRKTTNDRIIIPKAI